MSQKKTYVNTIIKEMDLKKEFLSDTVIETIYFGGGTPSLLSSAELKKILDAIYTRFEIAENPEITLEVNPDDVNKDYIRGLKKLPVNRVSIGIQSFKDEDLKFLNRRHSAGQAIEAVKLLQASGYTNLSIDLMYGLPTQSTTEWADNIRQALELDVPHISAYHLMYETGTALYVFREKGEVEEENEEASLEEFNYLIEELTAAGYMHYEISNFARPGFISRHNSSYWSGKEYLGLGPSAHSYNGKQREWNLSSLKGYIEGIERGLPDIEGEILNTGIRYNDAIITGLRTMWGVNLDTIRGMYGEEYVSYCRQQAEPLLKKGLLKLTDNTLTLTREGIFISDSIMSDLLYIK